MYKSVLKLFILVFVFLLNVPLQAEKRKSHNKEFSHTKTSFVITQDSKDSNLDEVWIKVKYKKTPYYIVKNEQPQYIYTIINDKKGSRVGHREFINNKKKYTIY